MDVSAVPAARSPAAHLGAVLTTVRTEVLTAAAAALGISPGRLRAELEAGTPLSDLAAVASMSVAPSVVEERTDGQVDLRL